MTENQDKKYQTLKLLTEWFYQERYVEVIKECEEILLSDPSFIEAKDLLERSKEKLTEIKKNSEEIPNLENTFAKLYPNITTEKKSKQKTLNPINLKIFLKYGVTGIFIVTIIISGYFLFSKIDLNTDKKIVRNAPRESKTKNTEEIIESLPDNQKTIVLNNLKRYRDLQNIKNALEIYYITHKEFPAVQEMTEKLIKEKILLNIPKDPLHKQKTKNNEIFGYIYAIKNTEAGKNQAYIVSAIFQSLDNADSKLSALSNIDLPENFDFRDTKRANIILIE